MMTLKHATRGRRKKDTHKKKKGDEMRCASVALVGCGGTENSPLEAASGIPFNK